MDKEGRDWRCEVHCFCKEHNEHRIRIFTCCRCHATKEEQT